MHNHCRIIIEKGSVVWGKESVRKMMKRLADGEYMLSIDDWKVSKTDRQNRGFHGPICNAFSDHAGYTWEEAKEELKIHFGTNAITKDYMTGQLKTRIRSLGEYTKEEFTDLLTRVLQHLEYECKVIIDMEEKKKYCLDELTGELHDYPAPAG